MSEERSDETKRLDYTRRKTVVREIVRNTLAREAARTAISTVVAIRNSEQEREQRRKALQAAVDLAHAGGLGAFDLATRFRIEQARGELEATAD